MDEEDKNSSSSGAAGGESESQQETKPMSASEEVEKKLEAMRQLYESMQIGFQSFFDIQPEADDKPKPEQLLDDISVEGIARYIKSDKCKKIVVMQGAGISTSSGIPDFRSPETGLYHNLEKYNLPNPQCIFDITYFRQRPEPFFALAKELYPGNFKPTVAHYFIRLLAEKNFLLRTYTQNIDTLERVAGIPHSLIIEAHGTFHTAHCVLCKALYTQEWVKSEIFSDRVPTCTAEDCSGLVKPDIVFFGESLPQKFFECSQKDFKECDLLIVMGTSLKVQPFASLVDKVRDTTPRLLINMEKVGIQQGGNLMMMLLSGGGGGGFDFDSEEKYRDVACLMDCDSGCLKLAELLGWKEELEKLVKTEHDIIDKAAAAEEGTKGEEKETETAGLAKEKEGKGPTPTNSKTNEKTTPCKVKKDGTPTKSSPTISKEADRKPSVTKSKPKGSASSPTKEVCVKGTDKEPGPTATKTNEKTTPSKPKGKKTPTKGENK